jgi:DNA repair protein RAD50
MTSLDKLSISGVRAYSPDAEQVIQFFHPLTIIVGSNGSGKTTIIEALRFATTGTAPETSERGKNFVHDPRVRSEFDCLSFAIVGCIAHFVRATG